MINISVDNIINLVLFSNLVFFALYPFGFLFSTFFSDSGKVNSFFTPITLVLVFSVTLPSLVSVIQDGNPSKYYQYLVWNPLFVLNDFIQYQVGIVSHTWLPLAAYVGILTSIFALGTLLSLRLFKFTS